MKFTLSWLKTHLETDKTALEIADALTALGLELEGIDDRGAALAPFTVAYVIEAKPHPNADRLRVCRVETATGEVQVVCGAPNARTGMKGVFAPVGSHIPGTGLDLKAGTIRGEASNGMLCSAREMGLSDEHDGIIELPEDAPVGSPFAQLMGLDDPMIDISVTPNRADCLSVRGIARDLAAAGHGRLKPLAVPRSPGAFESPISVALDLDDSKEACPLFAGRYFRGVRNGPSPQWLQNRLTSIGLRPISALVDITNYMTFDLGRPLHVFDAGRVAGNRLTVHLSRGGETLAALNDKTYSLEPGMTVISDGNGVEALGGVIGGQATGCEADTTDVFLEVALFDPIRTAQTGRKLGIVSDARYRFERGLDPAFVLDGLEIATAMILELCGGEASAPVIAGQVLDTSRRYTLRPDRCLSLGGVDVASEEQIRILTALGCDVTESGGTLDVGVPSWRGDIIGEADLVEEILRVRGYDAIPVAPLPRLHAVTRGARSADQRRVADARRVLAAAGLLESVTFSFMTSEKTALFGGGQNPGLRLLNPISADLDEMRPSILPNLIEAAVRNADRGYPDLGLFEVGPQFAGARPQDQTTVAAGIRAGKSGPRHWKSAPRPVDAFDAKADALAVLAVCGGPTDTVQVSTDAPSWYHPGRSGTLRLGPKVLAWFGEIHPLVARDMAVRGPLVGFEVFLDQIPLPKNRGGKTRPALTLSPFQPVSRDFAFVVLDDVPADKVTRAARGADKALITDVSVFDVYRGHGLAEGHKSLAIAVTLQPVEKTLTEEDIEAVSQKIIANVQKQTGGTLRG